MMLMMKILALMLDMTVYDNYGERGDDDDKGGGGMMVMTMMSMLM